ncbi:LLM class flavin-dependent oxidoreductase [Nocardia sp. alder85J]|uniref:LLM class flavin-dependent oxidoreductase n=1 Tax=Nocardia sp. alder85J TaxID=2862949 RepID=UPI001CD561BF|nr:LLM class flavin-dependent oxidoreductase [Nocardia sp. alder85J]MCX4092070.1 LLM class flavin-dependent oxidoreductase [Nocardia sp. alder85J]
MTLVLGVEIPDEQLARVAVTGFDRVPELLDAAGVGYVVLGGDRAGAVARSLDPSLIGVVFARRTRGLGIVTAGAAQRDHPYNLARRVASLDHLSGGRAGWLALRADQGIALGATGQGSWAPASAPVGAELAAEAVAAARALWRTWPIESLTTADAAGRPADAEVRYADHTGVFATTGPLNVPTTPQGEPVVWWDYRPGDVEHAAVADIALVSVRDRAAADADLAGTVAVHLRADGRDPELAVRLRSWVHGSDPVAGVLIRLDLADLGGFLERTLPVLADAGLVRLRSGATTLRDQLGIARRAEPDPLRLRPVYVSA